MYTIYVQYNNLIGKFKYFQIEVVLYLGVIIATFREINLWKLCEITE